MTNYQPKKKIIVAIAEILRAYRGIRNDDQDKFVDQITEDLSDYFASINPDFDPKRFREMVEGKEMPTRALSHWSIKEAKKREMVEGEKRYCGDCGTLSTDGTDTCGNCTGNIYPSKRERVEGEKYKNIKIDCGCEKDVFSCKKHSKGNNPLSA